MALAVVDLGDVEMPSGETERSLALLEDRVAMVARQGVIPIILGGDHTIALPDVTGVAHHLGFGRVRSSTSTRTPTRARANSARSMDTGRPCAD